MIEVGDIVKDFKGNLYKVRAVYVHVGDQERHRPSLRLRPLDTERVLSVDDVTLYSKGGTE